MKTLLGKKLGMTQIFTEQGAVVPVTVIEAGPATVTQIKTVETDGYDAVQIGFEDAKPQRVNKPMAGHFAKNEIAPKKYLAEFKADEGTAYEVGQVITVAEFEVGAKLDVTGTSKGKGTQGNIKRHGHHRG
ncbi:MAG: 50S ribosomal protein L3, partial [Lentihominibacter sp.]|nr:50S ribosomal protein L3 [Lentihominibacter sp.]